jgi:molybdopterin-guanine dinucleotide biosynthesis protein MobB
MPIPVVSIIGKSKSGKTTLLEKLIPALREKGYRVGTVKHHVHAGFEIDQPGKDTWRHAQAGSQHVVIAAPDKIASYRLTEVELSLDDVLAEFRDVDIILVEGYKRAGKPAVEIVRAERGIEVIGSPEQLIAVVTDTDLKTAVPSLDLDDIQGLATLIEAQFLVNKNDLL